MYHGRDKKTSNKASKLRQSTLAAAADEPEPLPRERLKKGGKHKQIGDEDAFKDEVQPSGRDKWLLPKRGGGGGGGGSGGGNTRAHVHCRVPLGRSGVSRLVVVAAAPWRLARGMSAWNGRSLVPPRTAPRILHCVLPSRRPQVTLSTTGHSRA